MLLVLGSDWFRTGVSELSTFCYHRSGKMAALATAAAGGAHGVGGGRVRSGRDLICVPQVPDTLGAVARQGVKDVSVQVGSTILGKKDRNLHQIEKLLKHQDFSRETDDNDIALLLLSSPIEINRLTTPICLPPVESFKIENWKSCHVAGWGLLSEGGTSSPSILQNVEMVLIDWDTCLGWMWIITKNMLCAGYEEGGKDACQGDSGGPLMCRKLENNTWYQVGIVSWGEGCGRKNTPGIYTFLPNYLTWIQKATTEAGRPLEQNLLHMPQEASQQASEDKFDTNKNNTETPPKSCSTQLMHGILMCQYLWFSVAVLQESTRFIR